MLRATAWGGAIVAVGVLCGSASAFDDSALPQDRGGACSSLCRSWMGLGREPTVDPAPAGTVVPPSRGTVEAPDASAMARSGGTPGSHKLEVRQSRTAAVGRRIHVQHAAVVATAARTSVSALRTAPAAAAKLVVGSVASRPNLSTRPDIAWITPPAAVATKLPVSDIGVPPTGAASTPPAPARDVAAPALGVVTPQVDPLVERSAETATVAPALPDDRRAPVSAASLVPSALSPPGEGAVGTPLDVKLGVYAVLGLIGVLMRWPLRLGARWGSDSPRRNLAGRRSLASHYARSPGRRTRGLSETVSA